VALESGLAPAFEDRQGHGGNKHQQRANGGSVTAMPMGPIPVVGNSAMGTNSA
jgi:hypothetical protein